MSGVPDDLPDRLKHWTVEIDPTLPPANRRLQAYGSFMQYSRELSDHLRRSGSLTSIHRVQEALGTTLPAFLAVADSAEEEANDG